MTNNAAEAPLQFYTRVAGLLYTLIIVIGVLNGVLIDSRIIVAGNYAATAHNIVANEFLFRTGIISILILYGGVAFLAWALYVILKNVHQNLALLAMLLRLGEAILGAATVLISFTILLLLKGEGHSSPFSTEQMALFAGVLLDLRTAGLDLVLLFVGLGGALFCYLFLKSEYVPGILAWWGIFTYLSMICLSFISILQPDHPVVIEIVLYSLGGLFEFIFGCWLFFMGVKTDRSA